MATNQVLIKPGTQLLFADHAGDFGAAPATAANSLIVGAPTDVQMDLGGIAASGGAWASAKATLGATTRAAQYAVMACLEFAVAPADGGYVLFKWAPSPSSTAATGNPGGVTGSSASFTDTTGNLAQMQDIGYLYVRNDVTNIGFVGIFTPGEAYGSLVVVNQASQAMATTADEIHVVMTPIIDDIQAAA